MTVSAFIFHTWEFFLYPDITSDTEKKEVETREETLLLSLGPSIMIDNEELIDSISQIWM